ncbi:MAG: dihydropteroate synthase [Gammaproteobacteria bacterium]|jgi:dihydropteroate synthase|nr:dihydropteroate synthase [Gammaproteobacteria bacterium]MDP6615712.1 dihydropteroate synthase [Gammaproteobacteria bacterium]MDP6695277.1 dihydropteroate synthase [Gammaproteobacteria bacterium]
MRLIFPNSQLDLGVTRVMGILNVTPDSFSDGGLFLSPGAAVERALQMAAEGADIIDVGGESTRPGAQAVSVTEELERVVPVIEAICRETPVPVSVDTSKPEVMQAAANAGAAMLNDVYALTADAALATAAELGLPVCLMHMQGKPGTMQDEPAYKDVINEVLEFLQTRAASCIKSGIDPQQIVIDPGFGFGKTLEHNLELLAGLDRFAATGFAVLAGLSRKSMIAKLMGARGSGPESRVGGSVTLALYAARKGAHIVRVHDVQQTVEALEIARALQAAERGSLPGQEK